MMVQIFVPADDGWMDHLSLSEILTLLATLSTLARDIDTLSSRIENYLEHRQHRIVSE